MLARPRFTTSIILTPTDLEATVPIYFATGAAFVHLELSFTPIFTVPDHGIALLDISLSQTNGTSLERLFYPGEGLESVSTVAMVESSSGGF